MSPLDDTDVAVEALDAARQLSETATAGIHPDDWGWAADEHLTVAERLAAAAARAAADQAPAGDLIGLAGVHASLASYYLRADHSRRDR